MWSPIGDMIVAPNGAWLEVNPALTRIVGYPRERLLGGDFQVITHPDDLEADLALVHRMLAGEIERYELEKRYLHATGRIVWVELHVTLLRNADGTPSHFISQIIDITERRRTNQSLLESRAKLRLALQGAGIGDLGVFDVEAGFCFSFDDQIL